jgi:DNA-binding CsgD family transcriptional regulator
MNPIKDEHGLTPRQREVMLWSAKGFSNKEVGAALGISANTVGDSLKLIYKALDINRRAELVLEAQRIGLLSGVNRRQHDQDNSSRAAGVLWAGSRAAN